MHLKKLKKNRLEILTLKNSALFILNVLCIPCIFSCKSKLLPLQRQIIQNSHKSKKTQERIKYATNKITQLPPVLSTFRVLYSHPPQVNTKLKVCYYHRPYEKR